MQRFKKIIPFYSHGVSRTSILKPTIISPHHCRHSSSASDPSYNHLSHTINTFLSIQSPKDLQSIIQHHAFIITTGHHTKNIFISSKLISLYAFLGEPSSCKRVFDSFHGVKDTFLWNSIIKAYFFNRMYPECLEVYGLMRVMDTLLPNQFTVPMVVSACAEVGDLVYGMIVHGLGVKVGIFEGNTAVGSSFVYMYSKCGCVDDAGRVFDEMSMRDVVAWTALVIGYVQNGESEKGLRCFCEMYRKGGGNERPNLRTTEGAFQACGESGLAYSGRCLHGLVVKSGLECSTVVQSSILSMYSKCGTLEEAYLSFSEVPVKDIKSWTSIISVYGRLGHGRQCLGAFMEMLVAGIHPDPMVVSCVLSGLANSMHVSAGKTFHGFIFKRNYDRDQMVHNALLSMYCKFGVISSAENVFKRTCNFDEEFWNLMVFGYGKVGWKVKCIELFTEMVHLGINPNPNSLVAVISSCFQLGEMRLGRSLHCFVIKSLIQENVCVSNSLIDMYGKSGNLTIARRIFCKIEKDTISWNTMISIYTHHGHYLEAFSLFDKMVSEGNKPSSATLVSMLSACGHSASLEKGEQIHKYIDQEMLESNLPLATALIDMYAKCGQLEKSKEVFDTMKERDVVSWNVMISGYGMHGDAMSAIHVFQQMEQSNVRPNELTFLAILSACNHAGLVNEGKSLFGRMGDYSMRPTLKHYSCMVDLLGRSGNLLEAENLVLSMPIAADGGLWGTLLSACKTHDEPEMGIRIAKHAIESDPENDGYYILISNLYDSVGMWEEAERMRNFMKEKGVRKAAGWSAV